MELTRLNKYIAQTGYCSRRKADELIENGSVKVNGGKPELGQKVSHNDIITVKGVPIVDKKERVYMQFFSCTKGRPHPAFC